MATVIINAPAPAYDPDPVFTVDSGQGLLIGGQGSLTGTYLLSQGYSGTIQLFDANANSIGSTNISNSSGSTTPWTIPVPVTFEITPGDFSATLTPNLNHNSKAVDPITAGQATFGEGFTASVTTTGIIIPDSTFTVQGLAPLGALVDVTFDGTLYQTNASLVDNTWSIVVTVPPGQALGNYPLTISTSGPPANSVTGVSVDVVSPSLTLDSCPSGLTFSGGAGSWIGLSGEVLPSKIVTLTFTGIDGRAPVNVVGTAQGIWQYQTNLDWIESGSWDVTISAPSETNIVCAGTHEPALDLSPDSIIAVQGQTGLTQLVRGPANEQINITVEGPLAQTFAAVTNALGFYILNLGDLPLLVQAEESHNITYDLDSGTQSIGSSYTINPRIEITINVGNPSILDESNNPVLFTNGTYSIAGSAPTNGVYSLSAIGSTTSFTLLTAANDIYTAELVINNDPGSVEVSFNTVFQSGAVESYIVAPPTFFTIPQDYVVGNQYDLSIFTDPGTLCEIRVTSDLDGQVLLVTGEADGTGEFTVNFDTTGLQEGAKLTIRLDTEWFNFFPQERTLDGLGSGLPSRVDMNVGFSAGNLTFPNYEPRNVVFALDNQLINEGGVPGDPLVSDFIITWQSVLQPLFFEQYVIEFFNAGSWDLELTTTDTQAIITDFSKTYRIFSEYSGMLNSIPFVIDVAAGVVYGKSYIGTHTGFSAGALNIVTPEADPFFTFNSILPEEQDGFDTNVNHAAQTPNIVTPEDSPFFTFNTVLPEEQDSLSTHVGHSAETPNIVTPEDSPFFTLP